jgi:hypothetical protein
VARPTNDPSNYFATARQSAKDVEGTSFFFYKHLEGTGFDTEMDADAVREGGDGQEVGLHYKTAITADGGIVVNARSEVTGRLCAYGLGQEPTVGSIAAGIQRHVAAPAASVPYLTAEQLAPADVLERSTNNIISGLTWEFEAGKPIQLTAQMVHGGSVTRRDAASALAVTREVIKPFMYPGASIAIQVNDSGGGAATAVAVTKGKVEVARGVDDDIRTTGLNREDIIPLTFDTNVDVTIRYEDRQLWQRVHYGVSSQIQIDLATGTLNLFSQRGSFSHRLNVPVIDWTGVKLNRLDPDGKTVYVDLAGMSVKHASHAIFTETVTPDPTSYLLT